MSLTWVQDEKVYHASVKGVFIGEASLGPVSENWLDGVVWRGLAVDGWEMIDRCVCVCVCV